MCFTCKLSSFAVSLWKFVTGDWFFSMITIVMARGIGVFFMVALQGVMYLINPNVEVLI